MIFVSNLTFYNYVVLTTVGFKLDEWYSGELWSELIITCSTRVVLLQSDVKIFLNCLYKFIDNVWNLVILDL